MLQVVFSHVDGIFEYYPINLSVSGWKYTNVANYFIPCNAMVCSIIAINVSVSGWYIQMLQIIFPMQCSGIF